MVSMFYDLVLNCYLREDVSDEHIQAIQCLINRDFQLVVTPKLLLPDGENVWEVFYDKHFLAPAAQPQAIASFVREHITTIPTENNREVHLWTLKYIGRWIKDEFYAHHHLPFVIWLGRVAREGFLGYTMESYLGKNPTLLYAKNGQLEEVEAPFPNP